MRHVGTRSALFAAASLFTVTAADAADVGEKRSRGTGALAWETREPIVGPFSDKLGGAGSAAWASTSSVARTSAAGPKGSASAVAATLDAFEVPRPAVLAACDRH